MAVEVRVPGVGESVQEGMIESWKVSTGGWVERDAVLLELETDKATVEVVASVSGVVELLKKAGEVVKVGELIARIDETASKGSAPAAKAVAAAPAPKTAAAPVAKAASQAAPQAGPAARHMAAEYKIDINTVQGQGRGGRVTKEDLLPLTTATTPVIAAKAPAPPMEIEVAVPQHERASTRKPMSMLRRRIAERLLESQSQAAILTTFNEIDMTEVMNLRSRYKESFEKTHGIKLGFMGFFLKASATALMSSPEVNAFIEGTDTVYHNYCDIGVAVSTEKGLMVPIVRNVEKLSIAEIEHAIARYAEKARHNKISLDDLQGGTFTVSNGGVFGSLLSTPILNPPQSAILGMHKTQTRPVVLPNGTIAARPMMYLALSYDHRIIDGKEAVTFLIKIKDAIEDPSRMLLGV